MSSKCSDLWEPDGVAVVAHLFIPFTESLFVTKVRACPEGLLCWREGRNDLEAIFGAAGGGFYSPGGDKSLRRMHKSNTRPLWPLVH